MKIYYFIHITGTEQGISGVPRVVRNLGRELVLRRDIELIPVCWSERLRAIVHAEQRLLDNFSRNGGPELQESTLSLQPVAPEGGDWLFIAEVPHLQSGYLDYPSILIDEPIGYARRRSLRVAVILHDIMPLTHTTGSGRERLFVDLIAKDVGSDGGELQRTRFTSYAHALALADILLPVSRTSGDVLADWLIRHGHRAERLPPIAPVLLPEEVFGARRVVPRPGSANENGRMEFISVGTVCAHKNQIRAMSAFHRLIETRPELDLHLNVVGWVTPNLAVPASLLAQRSRGQVSLLGHLPELQVRLMMKRARASVFVSLAEGYGLPVVESLWLGKPCLCSAEGSLSEIARGGGCLSVNPRSLDEIEAGFEALATDAGRYQELLRQISNREMRTWKQYADEIVARLAALSSGQGWPLETSEGPGGSPEPVGFERSAVVSAAVDNEAVRPRDDILLISASELVVHDAYGAPGRRRSLYYGSAIHYDQDRDSAVQQDDLFFGPYVTLPGGHYDFSFDGEIDGELRLAFTASSGELKIAEVALTSFQKPIPIDLPEAVERFEILGKRTPTLRRLTLRAAFAEIREHTPKAGVTPAMDKPPTLAAPPGAPSPGQEAVYALDDDGRALTLPFVLPASMMRVHDAFGEGDKNRLRAGPTIAFDAAAHGEVDQPALFFGPYLHLEVGNYSFWIDGDLAGRVRLRLTQRFAQETLLETVVSSFAEPIGLRLDKAVEKFEIIAERLLDTRALTLRSVEISRDSIGNERVGASARQEKAAPPVRKGKAWRIGSLFRR
jgi:glycosyltransferase involved in cell wall biosynthesis